MRIAQRQRPQESCSPSINRTVGLIILLYQVATEHTVANKTFRAQAALYCSRLRAQDVWHSAVVTGLQTTRLEKKRWGRPPEWVEEAPQQEPW